MDLKSIRSSLIILGITAIVLSRVMFVFFNDPEGPNLLVVAVATAVVYCLSLVVYLFGLSSSQKLLLAFGIQLVIVIGSYFFLR